jgi:phosphatidylinositol alpha 1,6-mannosyltransferase
MGIRAGQEARDLKIPFVTLYLISPSNISGWNRTESGRSAKLEDFFWNMFRDLYNFAQINLAPTGSAAGELEEHGIERVRVWEFGVDTEHFHPRNRRDRIRTALAPNGELIVGYVGRLSDEKQLELLAETANTRGLRLVLVGHGPDEPRLRSLMPGAYFAGSRQGAALARLYASFDVFVHPGGYETAGLTILEAQASGCAVIVPRSQGAADMVDADRTALVVEPHSGTAIAEAVARLAGDRAMLRGLADAARASSVDRSWAAAGDRLIGHFESARRDS